MSSRKRFTAFTRAFPDAALTYPKWDKITHWVDSSKTALELDMSIFPDGIEVVAWEHAPAKKITFCESQRKLQILSLNHSKITSVIVPKKLKKLMELYLIGLPLTTLELGGSRRTLEVLEVFPSTGRSRISLPSGMAALRSLHVGGNTGPVSLPKTAPLLTYLKLDVNIAEGSMRIPSGYLNLLDITAVGSFGGILVPKQITSLRSLELSSTAEKMILPTSDSMQELRLVTATTQKITIPEKWGEGMTVLSLDAPNTGKLELPATLPELLSIDLDTPNVKSIELPMDADKVRSVRIFAGDVLVNADLTSLLDLRINGISLKLVKGKTAANLRHISISKDTKVSAGFPSDMLDLETLCVNPKRVRFGKIYTPRLNWFLKGRGLTAK